MPATVLAVPFLGRLLMSGRCVDPRGVVALLGQIEAACRGILRQHRHEAKPAGSIDRCGYPLILRPDDDREIEEVFADYDLPTWALEIETEIGTVLSEYARANDSGSRPF